MAVLCGLGQYHPETAVECLNCPSHLYQDDKGKKACKKCLNGKLANNGSTACENPDYFTAEDCDFETCFESSKKMN